MVSTAWLYQPNYAVSLHNSKKFLVMNGIGIILLVVISICNMAVSNSPRCIISGGMAVDCSKRNLTRFPNFTIHFTNLTLDYNYIELLAPENIAGLPSLRVLSLQHNRVAGILEDSFLELPNLTHLLLHNNRIMNICIYKVFNTLTKLEILDLSHNEINTLCTDAFVNLSKLTTIRLENNAITGIPMHTFSHMQSLRELFLYTNQISTIHPLAFRDLASLRHVSLRDNELTCVTPETFDSLQGLQSVDLRDNPALMHNKLPLEIIINNLQKYHQHLLGPVTCVTKTSATQTSTVQVGTRRKDARYSLLSLIVMLSFVGLWLVVSILFLLLHYCFIGTRRFVNIPSACSLQPDTSSTANNTSVTNYLQSTNSKAEPVGSDARTIQDWNTGSMTSCMSIFSLKENNKQLALSGSQGQSVGRPAGIMKKAHVDDSIVPLHTGYTQSTRSSLYSRAGDLDTCTFICRTG